MSEVVTLTVNGVEVKAPADATVLNAARAAGFSIPTLCHHEKLAGFGACRLCIVEVRKGEGRSRIVASCLYPVEEGLIVETESERIVRHRRMILEMLRARWPNVMPDLVKKYEVPEGRLADRTNFCVMCGLCVRYCSEIKGANALGFVGRGTERQVVVHAGVALHVCPECSKDSMACLEICPTGVIYNDYARRHAHMLPTPKGAQPVRMADDDNQKAVNKLVGS